MNIKNKQGSERLTIAKYCLKIGIIFFVIGLLGQLLLNLSHFVYIICYVLFMLSAPLILIAIVYIIYGTSELSKKNFQIKRKDKKKKK